MNITLVNKHKEIPNSAQLFIINNIKQLNDCGLEKEQIAYTKQKIEDKSITVFIPSVSEHKIIRFIAKKIDNGEKEKTRRAGFEICNFLNSNKIETVYVSADKSCENAINAISEGIALSNYKFEKYLTKKEPNTLKDIKIISENIEKSAIEKLNATIACVMMAKDWVNEPLSFLDAPEFSKQLQKAGEEAGVKVEVLNKNKIEALKMGGLLAVNLGSKTPPTFTIMEYKPKKAINKKPIVLVGKGVVYDTGGLSLKPTANSMDYMKCDMGGAAVVGASICAAAKANLPLHIIALIPATDNRPGENAYVPGDVIKMYNGTTVEVLNTDAEGRMILADALAYGEKYEPELVMDFATLTGAAAAAIGSYGIVCMGTADENTKNIMKDAGNKAYERLAEFPFWDEYDDLIKSDIADIKNIGGPYGGAITAGKFLARFTKSPWMHFDIAGPAYLLAKDNYRGKGATGVGIRFMMQFFEDYIASKAK